MTAFQQQIEQDLEWREAEMGSLKLLLASATKGIQKRINNATYGQSEKWCQ